MAHFTSAVHFHSCSCCKRSIICLTHPCEFRATAKESAWVCYRCRENAAQLIEDFKRHQPVEAT